MSKRTITKELYNRIVDAYRHHGDRPYAVARAVGCDPRTAVKAWEIGWPKKGYEPVKTIHLREMQKARARLIVGDKAELLEAQTKRKAAAMMEREGAIEQAAQARAQEGQIVKLARGSALQALTVSVSLVTAAGELAAQVKEQVEALARLPVDDPKALKPAAGIAMLNRIADLQKKIEDVAMTAMQMERLHLGEPTQTVNVITSQTEMTLDEASARIEMATSALEAARKAGGLTVIDGGQREPVIGKKVESA